MKKIIVYLLLLIGSTSYSQKQLSQQAINDLTSKASNYLGIEQTPKLRAAVSRYITTFNRSGASAVMANLKTDLKGREDLLLIINRATSNRESLLRTLTVMNVDPKNIKEIADYYFQQPLPNEPTAKQKVVKDTSLRKEPPVQEGQTPIVWSPPSKKFFDGRKTFCDSSGKWYYTLTIIKSSMIITKYPGQPKIKSPSALTRKAIINGEDIVPIDGQPANYKFENNMLYEKAEDSNGWNKYRECKE